MDARHTPIKEVETVITREFQSHLRKYVFFNNLRYETKVAFSGHSDRSVEIILSPGLIETEKILKRG